MENPFLHKKFPDLQQSPEVKSAVRKKEKKDGPIPNEPTERINAYLERLESILSNPDQEKRARGTRLIKHMLHKEYVMDSTKVPQSHFELQKRIAKEQGRDEIYFDEPARLEIGRVLAEDQRQSLDAWVDYLGDPNNDAYPSWFKYYAFRSMLKLASYDKEKQAFRKRTVSTTVPYVEINREALAYVYDELAKTQTKKKNLPPSETNFGDLYAKALEKTTPTNQEQKESIEGEWKTYAQGSDPSPLVQSLQGYGTGWCTAGEQTAASQLQDGDFHVYYSKDTNGIYKIPRIAIRMEDDRIAEVRGINANQELEPKLMETAENRINEFPDSKEYKKKVSDMKRLTLIDQKIIGKESLNAEDLRFLYELDASIDNFGYGPDTRIERILFKRDKRADFCTIFNCTNEEMEEKEQVHLSDIPAWKELPDSSILREKYSLDWILDEEYSKDRPLKDFVPQNDAEVEPVAKVFNIEEAIKEARKKDPQHNDYLSTAEVLKAIDQAGYRPATIEELLAFGRDGWKPEADPQTLTEEERVLKNVGAQFVYGLNSIFFDANSERNIPSLCWDGAQRGLSAESYGRTDWDAYCHFLVLHKSSSHK